MSKDKKIFLIVTITQYIIFGISLAWAFLARRITPNWPFYLLLVGILIGNFIPHKYRSNFFSTEPGFFFKTKTRKFENIIYMTTTCLVILLVILLNILWCINAEDDEKIETDFTYLFICIANLKIITIKKEPKTLN